MFGLSGRSLCLLLLGQVGVTRACHADDLVPISVFHEMQSFFDEGILVGQRAYRTCVQHCIRNPTDPLLIHLIVYILKIMKCGDGVTVGWNFRLVELVVQSLRRHLSLWVMPLFEALKILPWRSASFSDSSVHLTLKGCIYKVPRLVCTSDLIVRKNSSYLKAVPMPARTTRLEKGAP